MSEIALTDVEGIGKATARRLVAEGICSAQTLARVSDQRLLAVDGIGPISAEKFRRAARRVVATKTRPRPRAESNPEASGLARPRSAVVKNAVEESASPTPAIVSLDPTESPISVTSDDRTAAKPEKDGGQKKNKTLQRKKMAKNKKEKKGKKADKDKKVKKKDKKGKKGKKADKDKKVKKKDKKGKKDKK